MDTAVHHQLVQGQTGHLAADRVKSTQKNGVRGVVHHNFNSRSSLQGPDVTALPADDAALDFVTLDGEGGDGVLDGRFRSRTLNGVDNDALGFLGSVQAGFIHAIVDISLGLGAGLGLHGFHQLGLGFGGTHAGDGLNLADGLGTEGFILFLFHLQLFFMGLDSVFLVLQFLALAVGLGELLVQGVLLLAHTVLGIADLGVLLIDGLLMLALEGEILFLGLKDTLVLDFLSFNLGLFQNLVPLPLKHRTAYEYVGGQGKKGPDQQSDK